jgi:hypothetical protein
LGVRVPPDLVFKEKMKDEGGRMKKSNEQSSRRIRVPNPSSFILHPLLRC